MERYVKISFLPYYLCHAKTLGGATLMLIT